MLETLILSIYDKITLFIFLMLVFIFVCITTQFLLIKFFESLVERKDKTIIYDYLLLSILGFTIIFLFLALFIRFFL